MAVDYKTRRFTTEQYYRMIETGIIREGERVELIDGEIVEMAAMSARHASSVARATAGLLLAVGRDAVVRTQMPIHLGAGFEPEPDIVVARGPYTRYRRAHPSPPDILLAIEVAESSLDYDRRVKTPLYARYAIPEAWLSDLTTDRILVHREPAAGGYQVAQVFGRGERVSPLAFPQLSFAVEELLD
jgi:Uma2 family endonuclease